MVNLIATKPMEKYEPGDHGFPERLVSVDSRYTFTPGYFDLKWLGLVFSARVAVHTRHAHSVIRPQA
jgi:hypothetical protein